MSRDASAETRDRETVASLSRGLRVIEAFNEGGANMTLSEVARRASISPAAARWCLRTLVSLGYVRSADRHYLLSARVLTEVNPKRLRAILSQVRNQGYATVVDQLFYGVSSLTVPILNRNGETIAALNTSTYTGQMSAEILIKTRLAELRRSAEESQRIVAAHPALQQALQTAPQTPLTAAAS